MELYLLSTPSSLRCQGIALETWDRMVLLTLYEMGTWYGATNLVRNWNLFMVWCYEPGTKLTRYVDRVRFTAQAIALGRVCPGTVSLKP